MFIVLGSSQCKLCTECIMFLDEKNQPYKYINLQSIFDDWRYIFRLLEDIIGNQRSIPIVFRTDDCTEITADNIRDLAKQWTFIGGLWQVQEYVFNKDDMDSSDY